MSKNSCFIGETNTNNQGTMMTIIAVRNQTDIDVKFLDEHEYIKHHVLYNAFRKGQVKNPFDPTVYSVGYIGVGKHVVSVNKIHTRMYKVWSAMIRRCYSNTSEYLYHSYYQKCVVCEEWKNMQNFGDWYEDNYYECEGRLHLDKDILFPGNKTYSPSTCLLIPQSLNALFINHINKSGLPNGIDRADNGRYTASYNNHHLGTFDAIKEAYQVYSSVKKQDIIKRMETIKNILPHKVIDAIYNYEFKLENDVNYRNNTD